MRLCFVQIVIRSIWILMGMDDKGIVGGGINADEEKKELCYWYSTICISRIWCFDK